MARVARLLIKVAPGAVAVPFAMAVLWTSVSCKDKAANRAEPSAAPTRRLSARALQIPTPEVQRLEVTRPGGPTIAFEREGEGWRIRSPLSYPAHAELVEPMAAVLGEIEVIERVADAASATHRLGDAGGIVVRAHAGDRSSVFTVGASVNDRTFIRREGEETVYAVRGHCRRVFDLSLSAVRDPVITNLDSAQIERVVFENSHGRLALVPSPNKSVRFVEETPTLRNFFTERATKSVTVLARLRAKGFVDAPVPRRETGLYEPDTPRAQLHLSGRAKPLTVYIGARMQGNLLHLRTSDSEQVFLVSGHFRSTLLPDPQKLERSDEDMQRQQRAASPVPSPSTSSDHSDDDHTSSEHVHGEMPKQVPPELLRSLRAIAESQHTPTASADSPLAGE